MTLPPDLPSGDGRHGMSDSSNRKSGGGVIRGLILAGGKSSRFGADKAMAFYKGVPFLERAASLLKRLELKPILVGRPRLTDISFLKCTTLYDKLSDQGPLGGLYTAMAVFKNTAFLMVSCDMPLLSRQALSFLLEKHDPVYGATLFSTQNQIQPFPGIYEPSLLGLLRKNLMDGSLSVRHFLDQIPSKNVMVWQGDERIFSNVNTRDDLKNLVRMP